jgi:predicted HTH transcriptional regulator
MDYPADINQWDYNTITRLVTQGDAEPGVYDFKEVLSGSGTEGSKQQVNESIRKTACAMANADGGYIIFGVKDAKKYPGLTAEQRIVGIPKSSEYLKEFGNKIAPVQRNLPCVYPDRLIEIPGNDTHSIFVVHIPLSPLRPHMIAGMFYKRVGTGSAEPMEWHEVRDQMLYTEGRLQKVRLLRLKIAQIKKLREQKLASGYAWEKTLTENTRYDTSSFEVLLADVCDLLPADLLRSLLDLARAANDFNIVKDPNIPFTYNDRFTASAEKSNLLGKLCEQCEENLAKQFGPLTIDNS